MKVKLNHIGLTDCLCNSLPGARREARKAFLAFSSDDGKAHAAPSGSIQGELENYTKQPANDDVSSSQDTHVRTLLFLHIKSVFLYFFHFFFVSVFHYLLIQHLNTFVEFTMI